MTKIRRTIGDLPHCNLIEAAGIFGIGERTFKPLFESKLHKIIRSQKTAAGYAKQYLLIDVFKAAFPDASNHTVHVLLNDWLMEKAKMTAHNLRKHARQRQRALKGAKKDENLEKTA